MYDFLPPLKFYLVFDIWYLKIHIVLSKKEDPIPREHNKLRFFFHFSVVFSSILQRIE